MIQKKLKAYRANAANRAAINTIVIYSQRFFAAALSLITTPLILKALGIEDYGLYTLTIGFVGMLAVLNWSLSNATQRYTAFAIGEGNFVKLKKVYSTSLVIHFLYGLLLFTVIVCIGYFFVEQILNIPHEKIGDAKIVLYIVAFVSFLTIVSIPFLGMLRSQENFIAIALVGITESILKLGIAIFLLYVSKDKLIIYAFLLMVISLLSFSIYLVIIKRKYKMVSVTFSHYDKGYSKEIFSFLSWSLLGSLALTSRNEGVQILMNIFFGLARNAAYGLAMQVNSAMAILSQGIIGSLSPQIIKSAGSGDQKKMIFLMRTMSKFATFSVSIIAIPLFFQIPFVLKIWLHEFPEDTIVFIRLIIIFGQIMLLSAGIQTVFDSIGKVKLYNVWVSFILLLNLPIGYLFFTSGFPSYTIIIVGMSLELVSLNIRLLLLKKHVSFSIKEFYFDTIFRVFLPSLLVASVIYLFCLLNLHGYIILTGSFLITLLLYPILIYKFSLEPKQKEILSGMISKLIKRQKK
ncbi:MATE family efflux transporter [Flavobacterium sp. RSB2_4_14]|uniref:MATE family efflux transporter n=1 Tax=Flavobacterium sp. RSB2_4_14 TaxID=3447665 RepID=UPI003F36465B